MDVKHIGAVMSFSKACCAAIAAATACSAAAAPAAALTLEEGFKTPPNSAKPHTWYHMMNGNVTKEGITCDFEALAKAGVGGVQMFDAGCDVPPGPLKFNSKEWFDMFLHAHKEAKRLGLEICIPNCSGWSSSGGPWNPAANAMKKTVYTETAAKGPSMFCARLPRTEKDNGFYDDIAVLAYPTPRPGASISDLSGKCGLSRGGNRRDTKEFSPAQTVAKKDIIDLSSKIAADGTLQWNVPAGEWTILRIGYICNGRCNHPASEKGRGLEVDKLSASAMDWHFSQYVERLCKTLGISAGNDNATGFNNILVDSYEVGCQNWTQGLEKIFEKRLGYSLKPYLPAFAGRVVGSVDETERFFEDFRRLLADLFAENYAGHLTKLCHDNGLLCSIEPYGNGNSDDLQYGEAVDIPMAEYWSRVDEKGNNAGDTGNSRFAAYLAHVWGGKYAATESFTASPARGGRWLTTPYSIKAQGDKAYAEGINRIIYHRFVHQPWPGAKYLPGMTMGRWGMHFDRTQTWWHLAPEWLRYQSRCQWMLQEGRYAADVLFWCGESAPNSGNVDNTLPAGYAWDVCATKAVEMLKVRNGKIVAPGGIEYEMLVLPSGGGAARRATGVVNVDTTADTMSEKMARKIGELAAAGAKIVAPQRPVRAPGLSGGPDADAKLRAAVAESWAKGVMECRPEEALRRLGVKPDFATSSSGVSWIHRRDGSGDWYFVAKNNRAAMAIEASFRQTGRVPEIWDPETGAISPAPVWREEGGRTFVTLDFRPSGSAFVVFRKDSAAGQRHAVAATETTGGAETGKPRLKIVKAEYGAFENGNPVKGKTVDFTAKLAGDSKDGEVSVQIDNFYVGRDPAYQTVKNARISYVYDGKPGCAFLKEDGRFSLPETTDPFQSPGWEWRDGKILAWRPATVDLKYSDGSTERASASPAPAQTIEGAWNVSFPAGWDAPASTVFPKLASWTESSDDGVKYFSGTATYSKRVALPSLGARKSGTRVMLDLGEVKNFAEVKVNGKTFAPLWRPPFRLDITEAVAEGRDVLDLEIKVTNLWPNRLIGDDRLYADDCKWWGRIHKGHKEAPIRGIPQWVKEGRKSPTGRHTFTTFKHWSRQDDLLPSGLIGPVRVRFGETCAAAR